MNYGQGVAISINLKAFLSEAVSYTRRIKTATRSIFKESQDCLCESLCRLRLIMYQCRKAFHCSGQVAYPLSSLFKLT